MDSADSRKSLLSQIVIHGKGITNACMSMILDMPISQGRRILNPLRCLVIAKLRKEVMK